MTEIEQDQVDCLKETIKDLKEEVEDLREFIGYFSNMALEMRISTFHQRKKILGRIMENEK